MASIMSSRCLRNTLTAGAIMALVGTAMADARIVSPEADETVHSNSGSIRVVVQDVPNGLQLQPSLDGEPASEPLTDSVFYLHDVPRGTHELTVKLLDASGREVMQTSSVTFHVWQASSVFRQRPR